MGSSSFHPPDGLSFESSIFIDNAEEEKEWLNLKYPGFVLVSQSVQHHQEIPFDVMIISTTDGKELTIYFDISEFFNSETDISWDDEL